MNKKLLSFSILISSIIISGAIIGFAIAQAQQDPFDSVQYPVKELGNCQSKEACGTYCDKPANIDACLAFAEKNNLMSGEELAQAKKFKEIGMIGPGGCNGKDSCDKYCSSPDNMEECITFAQKNGLMSGKELEESQKVLTAIKKGIKPPACGGKDKCDAYCSSSDHMEECMAFAIEAGLMPEGEKENAQKMLSAIKQGIKPPACRGEEECQEYCSQDAHIEECVKFGEAAGMMKPEDAAMMRKTGGKGPGGCKSKTECEAFCNNPDNSETCFNFGKDNGLISQEDLQKMEQGKQQMQQSFSNMPAEVSQCLISVLGADTVEKMKSGTAMPSQNIGEQMKKCFEQFMPRMDQQGEKGPGQGGDMQSGDNNQGTFGPGRIMNQQTEGPGGCKSLEECKSYCQNNPDECRNFQPTIQPGNAQPQQGGGQPGQFGPMKQQGQEGQYQPGQMMPPAGMQSGQPGEFQPKELNQTMPLQNQQPGQFIQGGDQMMPLQQFQGQMGEFQQQMMQQQYQQQPMQGQFAPSQEMMQFQQQMMPGPESGALPPPASEPAIQPAPPQPEPAPSTMNSNNLFGTIMKPFAKIFGL